MPLSLYHHFLSLRPRAYTHTQAGSTVMVGGSFHMLPLNQGVVGTAAICILMPFGALAVLVVHMLAALSARKLTSNPMSLVMPSSFF